MGKEKDNKTKEASPEAPKKQDLVATSVAALSEFKGNKMIVLALSENDRFPFQFGYRKAKLVVKHIEDIKSFVDSVDAENKEAEEAVSA